MIASVQLPKDNQDIDLRKYEENSNEIGGYGAYNIAEIQITQKIVHEGEVNRARYQFENPNVIATKSRSGEVYVFDRTMHASFPNDETFNPDLRLVGHSQEGAGYDGIIAHWDITAASKENRVLSPLQTYKAHKASVSDVGWNMKHDSIFSSVSDDGQLMIWDTRNESYKPINHVQAHSLEANCVEFSPGNEWILATGSSDKTAAIWDLRNLNQKLHVLKGHQEEVIQLSWSPHEEAILATASNDRRAFIWDLARIGQEQSPKEAEGGPPELLFVHGGHTNRISDLCWNPAEPWMLGSCGDDNILQAWTVASTIHSQEKNEKVNSISN
ncbi:WD40-repeat-containing domain protein [Sporodiniella umbellata]|nr:WD40-repeat-containing domain protein [Sporodiniella umbellata]